MINPLLISPLLWGPIPTLLFLHGLACAVLDNIVIIICKTFPD